MRGNSLPAQRGEGGTGEVSEKKQPRGFSSFASPKVFSFQECISIYLTTFGILIPSDPQIDFDIVGWVGTTNRRMVASTSDGMERWITRRTSCKEHVLDHRCTCDLVTEKQSRLNWRTILYNYNFSTRDKLTAAKRREWVLAQSSIKTIENLPPFPTFPTFSTSEM